MSIITLGIYLYLFDLYALQLLNTGGQNTHQMKDSQTLSKFKKENALSSLRGCPPLISIPCPTKKTVKKKNDSLRAILYVIPKTDVYLKVIKDWVPLKARDIYDKSPFYSTFSFKNNIEFIFIHEVFDSPPLFNMIAHVLEKSFVVLVTSLDTCCNI